MVIGWRQFDTIASNFRQAGVGYSTDGGATWVAGKIEPGVFRSDPVLGVNATGKFFYNSLHGNLTTRVFPSSNGGATWGTSTYAYGGDKQWMAIDQTGGESDGFIHQAWSPAGNPNSVQTYNRSTDGGESFATPSRWPTFPLFWGTLDVASDGTLYVVGTDGSANLVAQVAQREGRRHDADVHVLVRRSGRHAVLRRPELTQSGGAAGAALDRRGSIERPACGMDLRARLGGDRRTTRWT